MTAPIGEGFPKVARIRRRREFLALGRTSERYHCAHFTVLAHPRADAKSRLGVTVSRKVGGAVTRNRVKRCIREAFRRHPRRLLEGHELVVIAKPGAGSLPCREIAEEIAAVLSGRRSRRPHRRS